MMMRMLSIIFFLSLIFVGVNSQTGAQNDIAILNFALTLENLESAFYTQFQATFSPANFSAAGYDPGIYTILDSIRMHEATHVSTLQSLIPMLGGVPVAACTYHFNVTTVASYLSTADLLENTGVSAYDGAIAGITNPIVAQAAATIATVEARHAAYLNGLVGVVPFPAVTDTALLPTAILAAAGGFIVSCPTGSAPVAPAAIRPGGVALDSNNNLVHTGSGTTTTYSAMQAANDLLALNYALALEHLESAFYSFGQAAFSQASFTAAGLTANHEATHVAVLTAAISLRGGTPVPNCTYNFTSVNSVAAYVATARLLENTGVTAYDGAVNTITDTSLETLAATVATVEARHASYLNLISNFFSAPGSPYNSPFPTPFDNATLPAAIIAAVGGSGLVSNCSYSLAATIPTILLSSVQGDPRFVGFHGQEFQVHGIPGRMFNILSAPQLQLNAKFILMVQGDSMGAAAQKQLRLISEMQTNTIPLPATLAWTHPGTYLGEMGIKLGTNKIYIEAGGFASGMKTVTLNNIALAISSQPMSLDGGITIFRKSVSLLYITTPLVSFTIANSDKFLNIDSAGLNGSPADSLVLGGLLGQTAKAEGGLIDGKSKLVFDFLLDGEDIFGNDFQANKFVTME